MLINLINYKIYNQRINQKYNTYIQDLLDNIEGDLNNTINWYFLEELLESFCKKISSQIEFIESIIKNDIELFKYFSFLKSIKTNYFNLANTKNKILIRKNKEYDLAEFNYYRRILEFNLNTLFTMKTDLENKILGIECKL